MTDVAARTNPIPYVSQRIHLMSGLSRHLFEAKLSPFRLESEFLSNTSMFRENIESRAITDVQEKMLVLLRHIASKSEQPGASVQLHPARDYPIAWCRDHHELYYYTRHLQGSRLLEEGILTNVANASSLRLTVEGWAFLRNAAVKNPSSTQVFVAMWFDPSVAAVYTNAIKPLEQTTGFKMLRIDNAEFNEKICDRILVEIRRSRFMIADVTGQRQGVYFEAGFAMGLGLPVIWTCRKDEIEKTHFDTRQYNHIVWETPEQLGLKLADRILATVGKA